MGWYGHHNSEFLFHWETPFRVLYQPIGNAKPVVLLQLGVKKQMFRRMNTDENIIQVSNEFITDEAESDEGDD